ncbi:hypothetical protein [Chitinophaga arvensicola]|uniref:hypothetical protein n=1 Tax=Chitinophaga arvensicola TaxID=29529 RepID=UPI000B7F1A06|nr:hypothetical protein [Chitinophaga arvensicola]
MRGKLLIPGSNNNQKEVKTVFRNDTYRLQPGNPYREFIEALDIKDYSEILEGNGIEYQRVGRFLYVGTTNYHHKWVTFISCNTQDTLSVLKTIIKFLKNHNISFRIVENGYYNYRQNGGEFSLGEVGKTISMLLTDEQLNLLLKDHLNNLLPIKAPTVKTPSI